VVIASASEITCLSCNPVMVYGSTYVGVNRNLICIVFEWHSIEYNGICYGIWLWYMLWYIMVYVVMVYGST
jgi:hypothetical protein